MQGLGNSRFSIPVLVFVNFGCILIHNVFLTRILVISSLIIDQLQAKSFIELAQ